jgi:hypothetical protein
MRSGSFAAGPLLFFNFNKGVLSMLKLNDWVLLKAIFNQRLSDAVLEKDEARIRQIIDDEYISEKENEFIKEEPLDMERLYKEHNENINDEELIRRLI